MISARVWYKTYLNCVAAFYRIYTVVRAENSHCLLIFW